MSRCRSGRFPCGLPIFHVPRPYRDCTPQLSEQKSLAIDQGDPFGQNRSSNYDCWTVPGAGSPARGEQMRVALVNTNRIYPPVAPIGLDYVAETLRASGHWPEQLALGGEERWEPAIARFLANGEFGLVGGTVRNTDGCSFATRESFLPDLVAITRCLREHTGAPIVLGGAGFSIMPGGG